MLIVCCLLFDNCCSLFVVRCLIVCLFVCLFGCVLLLLLLPLFVNCCCIYILLCPFCNSTAVLRVRLESQKKRIRSSRARTAGERAKLAAVPL